MNYNKWKIIFLDFNTITIIKSSKYTYRKRLKILSIICKLTGAYIVLTSSDRDYLYDIIVEDKETYNDNYNLIKTLFKKYKIMVLDSTKHTINNNRQDDIIDWLARHEYSLNDYIIFDTEPNLSVLKSNLIYSPKGLKYKHIIQAIKMLGIK